MAFLRMSKVSTYSYEETGVIRKNFLRFFSFFLLSEFSHQELTKNIPYHNYDEKYQEAYPGNPRAPFQQAVWIPAGFHQVSAQFALILLRNLSQAVTIGIRETLYVAQHSHPFLDLLDPGLAFVHIHPGGFQIFNGVAVFIIGYYFQYLHG